MPFDCPPPWTSSCPMTGHDLSMNLVTRITCAGSKPFLSHEINAGTLGSEPLRYLLHALKPDHWFAAHMHVTFRASIPWNDGKSTKFVALNKCSHRNDFIEVIDFPHIIHSTHNLRHCCRIICGSGVAVHIEGNFDMMPLQSIPTKIHQFSGTPATNQRIKRHS